MEGRKSKIKRVRKTFSQLCGYLWAANIDEVSLWGYGGRQAVVRFGQQAGAGLPSNHAWHRIDRSIEEWRIIENLSSVHWRSESEVMRQASILGRF